MIDSLEPDAGTAFVIEQSAAGTPEAEACLQYIRCEPLTDAGFIAAFSTRMGGVSSFAPGGLSLGYGPNDSRENVDENRRRFLKAIEAPDFELITGRQTHSTERCVISEAGKHERAGYKCDALLARTEGMLLGVQTADCLPVLIGDPRTGVITAIHAGWRGTAGRIVERSIADLMRVFGVNPRTCVAALGPAACAECYEVGSDVIDLYKKEFGYWRKLLPSHNDSGKAYLDIRAANIQQMVFCGISLERIYVAPFCTMHNNDLFFSYRKEGAFGKKPVGRSLSVIGKARPAESGRV